MLTVYSRVAVVVVVVILVTGLAIGRASAQPFRCPDYVISEGQVVEIGETTITIHEWAGLYTYRIDGTERWRLQASQIRPGNKVQFLGCRAGEIAKEFRKM
jgi:hypothetical protein